jgi:FeS assembly protein IscX
VSGLTYVVKMTQNEDNLPQNITLDWDASYEIILALRQHYPTVRTEQVNTLGLSQLKEMIVTLPNFADDPDVAHDGLLREILREWYEEELERSSAS